MAGKAMLFIALCIAGIASTLLASCGAENSISTQYPCQFVFRTALHPGSSIETALNGAGIYTMVSAEKKKGLWHIYSTLNDGRNQTDDYTLSTDKENYANYSYLGAGNDTKNPKNNGFILGQSNFNGCVAWDRQCPNCIIQYGTRNFPLSWTGNRQFVTCAKCHRSYSLETGAISEGGQGKDDKALMRYRVSYAGIGSILSVGN